MVTPLFVWCVRGQWPHWGPPFHQCDVAGGQWEGVVPTGTLYLIDVMWWGQWESCGGLPHWGCDLLQDIHVDVVSCPGMEAVVFTPSIPCGPILSLIICDPSCI